MNLETNGMIWYMRDTMKYVFIEQNRMRDIVNKDCIYLENMYKNHLNLIYVVYIMQAKEKRKKKFM